MERWKTSPKHDVLEMIPHNKLICEKNRNGINELDWFAVVEIRLPQSHSGIGRLWERPRPDPA